MEALPFIQAAAAVFSAVGALSSGNAASSAAEYNARLAERNAQISRDQAAADAEQQQRHARLVIGTARAGYGASGITLEGSPLDVLAMSASNAELDRQSILYRGELRGMGYDSEAALDRQRASTANTQGFFGAASALLTGGAKAAYFSRLGGGATSTSGYQLGDYGYETGSLA